MNNYKVMFYLRILKSIVKTFLDSFLVLYFLDVSSNNILPLGIYKLVAIFTIYAIMFFTKDFCKSKNRIYLTRIGIIINFIYFATIIGLRENVVNHIYLIGFLYGLEEGFYYSMYNNLESSLIENKERARFTGNYTSVNALLSIILPLIFGSLIKRAGFIKVLSIVLIIAVSQIILSFIIKDKNIPKETKADLKGYREIVKNNKKIQAEYNTQFFNGLTYSEGAFSYIVTIYIIKVFSDSVSLGIFTSIFSLLSALIGLLFAKYIKPKYYNAIMKIGMACTIFLLCLMIYRCNMVTIIAFNFVSTFSKGIMDLINGNAESNISNIEIIKNKYKVEYWLGIETALFKGRILSNGMFILMALIGSDIMMYIFVIFLGLYGLSSIRLQKELKDNAIEIGENNEKSWDNFERVESRFK